MKAAYNKAKSEGMLKRDTRWTLVFEDMKSREFTNDGLEDQTHFVEMIDQDNCCKILNKKSQFCVF